MFVPDYSGIGALAWDLYSRHGENPDLPYLLGILKASGSPVLDVGCATGRLLIPFLEAGLEVEGTDPTPDVLAICRRNLEERGLTATLYDQPAQALALSRRYRSILFACGTLQIVTEPGEAEEALRRFHDHLEPGGVLVLVLYNAWTEFIDAQQLGEWRLRARRALPDGTEIEKHGRILSQDRVGQRLEGQVRYRHWQGETLIEEILCNTPERLYLLPEMRLMLEQAGFVVASITGNYSDEPAQDGHHVFTLLARRLT